jgi:hypothetical protein
MRKSKLNELGVEEVKVVVDQVEPLFSEYSTKTGLSG